MLAEELAIIKERPKYNQKHATPLKPGSRHKAVKARRGMPLSQYERDLLRLMVYGMDDREIASSVGISPYTVQSRRRDILLKTGQHSTAKLIIHGRILLGMGGHEIATSSFTTKPVLESQTQAQPLELNLAYGNQG